MGDSAIEANPTVDVAPIRSWLLVLPAAVAVAFVSVLVRWPECRDSLWVDELHSAWAVWDGWSEIAPRAAAGNQTPWYFWLLWCWTQAFGGTERMLRLPSVLAVAVNCGVLVIAATRSSQRLTIGLLAGGLMCIDLNAIYFGTEVRSYAFVMLMTTTAAWAAFECTRLRGASSRLRDTRYSAWRWVLWSSIFFAVLLHPTAGLPLACLVVTGWLASRFSTHALSWKGTLFLGCLAASALPLAVNAFVVTQVWQGRHQWNHFGVPASAADLWTMWPWTVALVPIGTLVVAGLWKRKSVAPRRALTNVERFPTGVCLLSVVVLATFLCWLLASYAGVPLWHRRYIVGLLPLLCWSTADLWGATIDVLPSWLRWRGAEWVGAAVAMVVSITVLLNDQQTVKLWQDEQVVLRSEDWRGAVSFIKEHRSVDEPVYVGAELIESNALYPRDPAQPNLEAVRQYLLFPVSGPYAVNNAQPLGRAEDHMREDLKHLLTDSDDGGSIQVHWLIYRIPEPHINLLYNHANAPTLACPAIRYTEGNTQAFGTITVIRLETRWPANLD